MGIAESKKNDPNIFMRPIKVWKSTTSDNLVDSLSFLGIPVKESVRTHILKFIL